MTDKDTPMKANGTKRKAEKSVDEAKKESASSEDKKGKTVYPGGCCCGAVKVECTGPPISSGYCHCYHCRAFGAAEVGSYIMWDEDHCKIIGNENVEYVNLAKLSGVPAMYPQVTCSRGRCKTCGQPLFNRVRDFKMVSMTAFAMRDKKTNELPKVMAPTMHVFYKNRVVDIKDGLPKYEQMSDSKDAKKGLMKE